MASLAQAIQQAANQYCNGDICAMECLLGQTVDGRKVYLCKGDNGWYVDSFGLVARVIRYVFACFGVYRESYLNTVREGLEDKTVRVDSRWWNIKQRMDSVWYKKGLSLRFDREKAVLRFPNGFLLGDVEDFIVVKDRMFVQTKNGRLLCYDTRTMKLEVDFGSFYDWDYMEGEVFLLTEDQKLICYTCRDEGVLYSRFWENVYSFNCAWNRLCVYRDRDQELIIFNSDGEVDEIIGCEQWRNEHGVLYYLHGNDLTARQWEGDGDVVVVHDVSDWFVGHNVLCVVQESGFSVFDRTAQSHLGLFENVDWYKVTKEGVLHLYKDDFLTSYDLLNGLRKIHDHGRCESVSYAENCLYVQQGSKLAIYDTHFKEVCSIDNVDDWETDGKIVWVEFEDNGGYHVCNIKSSEVSKESFFPPTIESFLFDEGCLCVLNEETFQVYDSEGDCRLSLNDFKGDYQISNGLLHLYQEDGLVTYSLQDFKLFSMEDNDERLSVLACSAGEFSI